MVNDIFSFWLFTWPKKKAASGHLSVLWKLKSINHEKMLAKQPQAFIDRNVRMESNVESELAILLV